MYNTGQNFHIQPYVKYVFSCTDFNENPSYSTLLHVDLKCLIIPKLQIFDNTHISEWHSIFIQPQ